MSKNLQPGVTKQFYLSIKINFTTLLMVMILNGINCAIIYRKKKFKIFTQIIPQKGL